MKAKKTDKEKIDDFIRYPSMYSQQGDYPDRRQQEMKRRFGVLQSRRSYLERELQAVKICLLSLDKQMQSYFAYKQLSSQR